MSVGPISPVGGGDLPLAPDTPERRSSDRRRDERRARPSDTALLATGQGDDPSSDVAPAKPAALPVPPPAAFAAQLLGQPGKKRGLRGGPQILDEARSTYLSREYSGPQDRRPDPGVRKKTEI